MTDNRVMVVECDQYKRKLVTERLRAGLEPWGGMEEFVSPGDRVLLKVNLLMGKAPQEAVTTHPVIVQGVADLVAEAGGKPIIGDSPGGPFNKSMLNRVYGKTGMDTAADTTEAELNFEFGVETVSFAEGKVLNNLQLGTFVQEADVIINLPKFKTHELTKLTGAVKNMFGAVAGLLKAEYHLNMQEINDFADVLLDIAQATAPDLSIMDGIVGMEGEGPSGGDTIKLDTILISPDLCALDVAMADLAGVEPEKVPAIAAARERGLVSRRDEIEVLGDEIEIDTFITPQIGDTAELLNQRLPGFLAAWVQKLLRPKPVFDEEKCIQCGACIRSCPPQVITKTEKGVEADLDDCIRCFCCQELCPEEAVEIHRPWLGRLLFE